ncbi:DUF4040 family protein [Corynebacterium liangguodongii]|uniref:Cation:proton antiporter n=1 Tax=Corynebacterium liangguodongii TaxID=2079535 RepID=A0A2S0WC03_9CORY|nr:DUF4040 family protein [Corynebacterium liangguodongii]AWB83212.1 cation:proton antiporter [Corynebacterium liangguodongii]PWB98807.1 DUF4040 domain-containing protein [Corynebacterium liangguodongii]
MTLPFVLVLVSAAVAVAPVAVKWLDRLAGWPLALAFLGAAGALASAYPQVAAGSPEVWEVTWARDFFGTGTDVTFALRADGLSMFFALLALVIGAVVFIYSAAYLPRKEGNTSFYTIMTAFTLSVLLLVLADDTVLLFIGWELVSIASFLLIARSGSGGEAGSYRTLILTFFGGLTLLTALALASVAAGTTRLGAMLASDVWAQRPQLTTLIAILVAASAFTKAAQFPFHFWLPEAMAAATPVSAFLHAAAVVKAGIYLLLRFSTVFAGVAAWNWLLITVGLGTAVMSALFALTKTDLKQLTAYSTVSHLGWIVAAVGVGTPSALAAALVHTLAHALFKSSLFMLIGVIDHQAGTRDIRRLGPLYRQMPFTFGSVVVAAASMAAVPPLFGFVSKESILAALTEAPAGGFLLVVAGFAAFLTFAYCAKIVFGAFVDGPRDLSEVREAPLSLWLPAAVPGLFSIVAPFALSAVDSPISAGVRAIGGPEDFTAHLSLWHGITAPLIVSVLVLIAGVVFIVARKRAFAALNGRALLPATGNDVLSALISRLGAAGRAAGAMAAGPNPSRHLVWLVACVLALGLSVLAARNGIDGVAPAPRVDGLTYATDLIPCAIIVASVAALVFTRGRLTAAVLLGTLGVGMSLQMLLLGAPDVALTQFLVESLTVVVIMMVLRYQPRHFPPTPKARQWAAAALAIVAGVVAFAGVYGLTGRRGRSELAQWYLTEGGAQTKADNIVAVIIVEFRGFDTLGELSVLGMAAVVILAVTQSMPRYVFHAGTRPRPFGQSQLNALPVRKLTTLALPVIVVLSILIFFRGHTAPGGGFVAALVMATAFALSYLGQGADSYVVRALSPVRLAGWGIIIAISSGFLGFVEGGFMYAIHGEVLGQHLTTSLIFDFGIYLAVLGMITQAINQLGGYLRPGTAVEELPYRRTAENPLPAVPEPEAPAEVDPPTPDPINPADAPQRVGSKEA